jgi:hypothetical protein
MWCWNFATSVGIHFPWHSALRRILYVVKVDKNGKQKENMLSLHQDDLKNLFQNGKKQWIVKIGLAASLGIALVSAGSGLKAPTAHAYSYNFNRTYSIDVIRGAFGADADQAIRVAECESGLNPNAYNPSGAMGLFQIMPGTWAGTSEVGASPYNAQANAQAAHQIFVRDGYSWREWSCKP